MISVDERVYVKYLGGHNRAVQLKTKHYKTYHFVTLNNIALALVETDDLDAILNVKHECCSGTGRRICVIASEKDVNIHLHGGRG